MKKLSLLLSIVSVFLIAGCEPESDSMDYYMAQLRKAQTQQTQKQDTPAQFKSADGTWSDSVPSFDLGSDSEDITVSFRTDYKWTAAVVPATKAEDLSWVSLSKESGDAGSVNLTIKVQDNRTFSSRNAIVKITSGELVYDIQISQERWFNYFYIETVSGDATVSLTKVGEPVNVPALSYSFDGEDWTIFTPGKTNLTLSSDSPKVFFKAESRNQAFYEDRNNYFYFSFTGDAQVAVGGDLLYLLQNDAQVKELPESAFFSLFTGNTNLCHAEDLDLPDFVSADCYNNMFYCCTSLVDAPELPATKLAEYCYASMFNGCTSLVDAPELPATELAPYCCYYNMFNGCTSLVNAPELPATTLAERCYASMFVGCTSLVDAPELPATELASYCYQYMFSYCTSLVNAPALPATELALYCYQYMFSGCTSLVDAPELPATTLVSRCYSDMFSGCSNLASVAMLATDVSAYNCLSLWLKDAGTNATSPVLHIDPSITEHSQIQYNRGVFVLQPCIVLPSGSDLNFSVSEDGGEFDIPIFGDAEFTFTDYSTGFFPWQHAELSSDGKTLKVIIDANTSAARSSYVKITVADGDSVIRIYFNQSECSSIS